MPNIIDEGIGRTAREWRSRDRPVPHADFQTVGGFYIGRVMDDCDSSSFGKNDGQCMGRLWVYIPGYSVTRLDAVGAPGGTKNLGRSAPPKTDQNARIGWVLCYPLLPFFGSDALRENTDDRTPFKGESNTYGIWYQPRIGDMVGVLFEQGNPSKGYWIGCVPHQFQNFMVPGVAQDESDKGAGPVHEQNINERGKKKPVFTFFNALSEAGLIDDSLRGARTSSSRRESPSRVFGVKTPGDPDSKLHGHQIVLDDHPGYHGARIRTSKGNQIYFCDTNEFIYVNTARGNVWIEFDDQGHIHFFSNNSMSFHTMKDFNLTVEGNYNMDVRGNLNWLVKGTSTWEFQSEMDWKIGTTSGDLKIGTVNHLNLTAAKDIKMSASENANLSAQEVRLGSVGDSSWTVGGVLRLQATEIFENSGPGNTPTVSDTPGPLQFYNLPGPPTGSPPKRAGANQKYATAIVPQHEPWGGHSVPQNRGTPTQAGTTFSRGLQRGSAFQNASAPNSINSGTPTRNRPYGSYVGNPYRSNSTGEAPSYTQVGSGGTPQDPSTMRLRDNGLHQLTQYEGHRLQAYPDAGGYSIGYGHHIVPGDGLGPDSVITEDQAQALLAQDTARAQNLVRTQITQPLTQEQFDSLTRLAYNSPSALSPRSSVVQSINSGNFQDVPNAWMKYVNSRPYPGGPLQVNPGLVTRRQNELNYAGFTPAVSS